MRGTGDEERAKARPEEKENGRGDGKRGRTTSCRRGNSLKLCRGRFGLNMRMNSFMERGKSTAQKRCAGGTWGHSTGVTLLVELVHVGLGDLKGPFQPQPFHGSFQKLLLLPQDAPSQSSRRIFQP